MYFVYDVLKFHFDVFRCRFIFIILVLKMQFHVKSHVFYPENFLDSIATDIALLQILSSSFLEVRLEECWSLSIYL